MTENRHFLSKRMQDEADNWRGEVEDLASWLQVMLEELKRVPFL